VVIKAGSFPLSKKIKNWPHYNMPREGENRW